MSEEFDNNVSMYQEPQNNDENRGLAIASMVLGIVSLVTCCCSAYIGLVFAIIGLVLGILYKKKGGSDGMATAGIVCSIISIVLAVIVIILSVLFGAVGVAALQELQNSGAF